MKIYLCAAMLCSPDQREWRKACGVESLVTFLIALKKDMTFLDFFSVNLCSTTKNRIRERLGHPNEGNILTIQIENGFDYCSHKQQ